MASASCHRHGWCRATPRRSDQMSVIPLPLVAQDDDVRDRAVRLFTFLREYTQLRASTALTTDAYDEVIWLADVPGLPGCACAAAESARDGEVWLEARKPRLAPA